MRYHSQNLNSKGSQFWHGRAWLRRNSDYTGKAIRWEWLFGTHARSCALTLEFGEGDGDDGILLHVGIPFLFSVFLGVDGVLRCKAVRTGVGIHDNRIWFYPLCWQDETNHDDPWWRRWHTLTFPWELDHWKTEILAQDCKTVVWSDNANGVRKKLMDSWDERERAKASVAKVYPYFYTLKSGEVQDRAATYHVERMEWRARWWPLIWRKKVRTSIDIAFSAEVGEGTGSWKGGCTGCGYDLLPGETPLDSLKRMERERKFGR